VLRFVRQGVQELNDVLQFLFGKVQGLRRKGLRRYVQSQATGAATIIKVHYRLQGAEGPIMHIGPGEGGVPHRRGLEGPLVEREGIDVVSPLIFIRARPAEIFRTVDAQDLELSDGVIRRDQDI